MGILMIIFASLGLLATLASFGGQDVSQLGAEWEEKFSTVNTYLTVLSIVGLGLGILHLMTGIAAVRYKVNAPKLAKIYGITALLNVVVGMVVTYALLKPLMDELPGIGSALGGMVVIFSLIGAVWPILVLALMSGGRAKEACIN
jgi:uncharacterized membrane protein YidH (DUF202 family)